MPKAKVRATLQRQPEPLAGDLKRQQARGPFVLGAVGTAIGIVSVPTFLAQIKDGSVGSLTMLLTLTAVPAAVLGLGAAATTWRASMDLPRSDESPVRDACASIGVALYSMALAAGMAWFVIECWSRGEVPGRSGRVLASRAHSPIGFGMLLALFSAFAAGMAWGAWNSLRRIGCLRRF